VAEPDSALYLLDGQSEQLEAPNVFEYVPGEQVLHAIAPSPSFENIPKPQLAHPPDDVSPEYARYVPAVHLRHAVELLVVANFPAAQLEQAVLLIAAEYFPGTQTLQIPDDVAPIVDE
jgi:hypothetical protein